MEHSTSLRTWLNEQRSRLVDELSEACAIPSVSSESYDESRRMAHWLRDKLAACFAAAELVEAPDAPPSVIAHSPHQAAHLPGDAPRLLLYSHYDVQPIGEEWETDAFTPTLRDGKLYARGVADDKADIVARIHALEAMRELGIELPIDLVWLSEGAEEIGSPGLTAVVDEHADVLRSDACLWESYLRSTDGTPELGFGSRGLVYLELTLELLTGDQHSAFAGVVRSAPIELAHALSSMVDIDGRVLVEGLQGSVAPYVRDAAEKIPCPDTSFAQIPGTRVTVRRPAEQLGARGAIEPTLNVSRFSSGHSGSGTLTIVPSSATAHIDIRTVTVDAPERVVEAIETHLRRSGHDDIRVRLLHAIDADESPMTGPFAEASIAAARSVFGEPVLHPHVAGAGPLSLVSKRLDTPIVAPPGSTRMSSAIHGPNENISIDDYLEQIEFLVALFVEYGRRCSGDAQ